MIKMKRILFLTDFSPEAANALLYTQESAEKFSGRLYLAQGEKYVGSYGHMFLP